MRKDVGGLSAASSAEHGNVKRNSKPHKDGAMTGVFVFWISDSLLQHIVSNKQYFTPNYWLTDYKSVSQRGKNAMKKT